MTRAAAILALLAFAWGIAAPARAQRLTEADAKASFLYNLALFTEWSGQAPETAPFTICVAAATPVRQALTAYEGQVVRGRRLEVIDSKADGASAVRCDVLFVPALETRRLELLLAGAGAAVTVGESEDFLRAGGMVAVRIEQARLRFDVDLHPAEQAGIRFSSRLLAVASSVRRKGHVVKS